MNNVYIYAFFNDPVSSARLVEPSKPGVGGTLGQLPPPPDFGRIIRYLVALIPPPLISDPPSALTSDFYISQYAYTQYMRKFLITFRRIVAQSKLLKLI